MSETPESIAQQIAELEASLAQPQTPTTRRLIAQRLALLRGELSVPQPPTAPTIAQGGGASLGAHNTVGKVGNVAGGDQMTARDGSTQGKVTLQDDAQVRGVVVGVNPGTIQLFFGTTPPPDAKALLDSYLEWLISEHGYLRLGKLLDRERSGRDQSVIPEIALLQVYTSLATDVLLPADRFALDRDALREAMDAASPEAVLPDQVRLPILDPRNISDAQAAGLRRGSSSVPAPFSLGDGTISQSWRAARHELGMLKGELSGQWYKPETLILAVKAHSRLVLLGSPGSGKSTALRHLAVFIATALLSGTKTFPIPFFCPLGPLAQDLGDDPRQDLDALVAALIRPALGAGKLREGLREQIQTAITSGNAYLFFIKTWVICQDRMFAPPVAQVEAQKRITPASY